MKLMETKRLIRGGEQADCAGPAVLLTLMESSGSCSRELAVLLGPGKRAKRLESITLMELRAIGIELLKLLGPMALIEPMELIDLIKLEPMMLIWRAGPACGV